MPQAAATERGESRRQRSTRDHVFATAHSRQFIEDVDAGPWPRAPGKVFDDPATAVRQLKHIADGLPRVNGIAVLALCVAKTERAANVAPYEPAAHHAPAGIAREDPLAALREAEARFSADDAGGVGAAHEHCESVEVNHEGLPFQLRRSLGGGCM